LSARFAWLVTSISGLLFWSMAVVASGRREPWDSDAYWTLYLPLAVLLAFAFGMLFPDRAWRWALVVIFMQLPVMLAGGSGMGLLPLGIVLLLILSLPAILAAMLGAGMRGWLARRPES
jgi:hypothetical protein